MPIGPDPLEDYLRPEIKEEGFFITDDFIHKTGWTVLSNKKNLYISSENLKKKEHVTSVDYYIALSERGLYEMNMIEVNIANKNKCSDVYPKIGCFINQQEVIVNGYPINMSVFCNSPPALESLLLIPQTEYDREMLQEFASTGILSVPEYGIEMNTEYNVALFILEDLEEFINKLERDAP